MVEDFRKSLYLYRSSDEAEDAQGVREARAKGAKGAKGEKSVQNRRDLANELAQHMAKQADSVSSTIWSLGSWIVNLVLQPRRKKIPYEISSVRRYLSALAQRFIEVGSDFDLINADSDSVIDFYDEVLELNRDLDLQYVAARLQGFHAYAQKRFAVDDVDWGELDCGSAVPHGSPGTVGPRQYENALELLVPNPETARDEDLAAAFLLILAYRFGLRGDDAIGLQSRDWWDHEGMIVIHVQSNSLRPLKRRATSRRIVPQLEKTLEGRERKIITQFTGLFGKQRTKEPTFPLFAKDRKGSRYDLNRLRKRVNEVLQLVHCDKTITLHKGRHAFGARVMDGLMGEFLRPAHSSQGNGTPESWPSHMKLLLLGTRRNTRRAPWALCRILGHARPPTTFKSYIHSLPAWSDEWNASSIDEIDQRTSRSERLHATSLDRLPLSLWQPIAVLDQSIEPSHQPTTLQLVAQYLDFLRHGSSKSAAMRSTRISPARAARVDKALELATKRLQRRTARTDRAAMTSLLAHVSDVEWKLILIRCTARGGDTNVEANAIPSSVERGLQLLSGNRQLLMWDKQHFRHIGAFVETLSLTAKDVRLFSTEAPHPRILQWKTAYGLAGLAAAKDVPTRQIDGVVDGLPRARMKDRCALTIVPQTATALVSGYGLALLWAIFVGSFSD